MVKCPQCGELAESGVAFCARCGQGLSETSTAPPPALSPLDVGRVLKGGFEIVSRTAGTALENRYRAARLENGSKVAYQLRERIGRDEPANADSNSTNGASSGALPGGALSGTSASAASVEPVSGAIPDPTAKTAELKPPPAAATVSESSSGASGATGEVMLTESEVVAPPPVDAAATDGVAAAESTETADTPDTEVVPQSDDLGEVFGRVGSLSQTLTHPAFQRALHGFSDHGRVYLVYPDEAITPIARGHFPLPEADALNIGIQLCQAVSFLHRRGLRLNDICLESIAWNSKGRITVTGLDYISNDDELQADPIFNDGYTAPEIYRARKVDKRADIFSIGAVLYTLVTGDRIESETWREEAGPIKFYPPHVVSPQLEDVIRRALVFDREGRWANVDLLKSELVNLAGRIQIRSAALTDVGMVRELNEDIVMTAEYRRDSQVEPAQSLLYVVCDGMGGAEAGEIAASIAVGAIRNYVDGELSSGKSDDLCQLLRSALEQANTGIIEYAAANPASRGMGSTGVGLIVVPPHAAVAWVGDSRAYFLDAAGLRQVTKDHSLVQRLIEIGQITPEEARTHEHKNVITRSLGARQSGPAGAEAVALRLKRGDRLMLCSDGLTAHVDDGQIADILRRHSDPYAASQELIVAANAGGGTDNVSVIVVFAD